MILDWARAVRARTTGLTTAIDYVAVGGVHNTLAILPSISRSQGLASCFLPLGHHSGRFPCVWVGAKRISLPTMSACQNEMWMCPIDLGVWNDLKIIGLIIGKRDTTMVLSRSIGKGSVVLEDSSMRVHGDIMEVANLLYASVHISTLLIEENGNASPRMRQMLGRMAP